MSIQLSILNSKLRYDTQLTKFVTTELSVGLVYQLYFLKGRLLGEFNFIIRYDMYIMSSGFPS